MFGYFETSLLNINKSNFTNAISYGKKAVDTTAGYFGTTVNYLSSTASYLTPQCAKDLFNGKSSDHFANAASHTKEAAGVTVELTKHAVETAGSAALLGVQAVSAHVMYHGISNKLEDAKYMLKAAAYMAEYVSPNSLPTEFIKQASNITTALDGFVDAHPFAAQAIIAAGVIGVPAISGSIPAYHTVVGGVKMAVDAAKIAKSVACAGAEAVAGTILYANELAKGESHSELQPDAQTGFGDDVPHHTNIEPFGIDEGFIYACGEVFPVNDTI